MWHIGEALGGFFCCAGGFDEERRVSVVAVEDELVLVASGDGSVAVIVRAVVVGVFARGQIAIAAAAPFGLGFGRRVSADEECAELAGHVVVVGGLEHDHDVLDGVDLGACERAGVDGFGVVH
jgi:hypothetical protein